MIIGEFVESLGGPAVMAGGRVGNIFQDFPCEDERWLLLFFYPADYTWVCPTELKELSSKYTEFAKLRTVVWGISTDGVEVHSNWIEQEFKTLSFPLVSDRNWNLSLYFDVLNEATGMAYRGTILIDPSGIVRHYSINDNNVGRNIDEILRMISAFQESDASGGEVAPCGWKPGEKLLKPGS
jgi:alkyl hydroperoxide reductase subunit AhpC